MSWSTLPTELRNQIIGNIVEDYSTSLKDKDCPTLARYATVSREWQCVFETITFENISLLIRDEDDLDNFARSTSGANARRRHLIRNISAIIVLPGYQCNVCEDPESNDEIEQNNHVFTQSMKALLGVLSTWAPSKHPDGLTLELNIKSSSDTDHHFDNPAMHDRYPVKHWNWKHQYHDKNRDVKISDRCCAKVSTRMSNNLVRQGCRALERYLGSLLEFTDVRLPRVEVVTSFLQRLQFKRQLSPLALKKLMGESLVQLSSLRLERWCRPTKTGERKYIRDFKIHVLLQLPKSLQVFHYCAERPACLNLRSRSGYRALSILDVLSIQGRRFKEVSVVKSDGATVHLEDMEYMATISLSQPLTIMSWQNLERVCFNTGLLYIHNQGILNTGPDSDLLLMSASMAEMMPNLRSWEMYRVRRSYEGRLFRFSIEPSSSASILWKHWWPEEMWPRTKPGFLFSPQVKSAWDKVAILRGGSNVTCLVDENEFVPERCESSGNEEYCNIYNESILELNPVHPFTSHLAQCRTENSPGMLPDMLFSGLI